MSRGRISDLVYYFSRLQIVLKGNIALKVKGGRRSTVQSQGNVIRQKCKMCSKQSFHWGLRKLKFFKFH